MLTLELSSRLIRCAIDCVQREFPNTLGNRPGGGAPRSAHPVFFGCFDWHSAVHGHWAMAHLLRRFPTADYAVELRNILNSHFTPEGISGEIVYLSEESSYFFECPYGWAWYLHLCRELSLLSGSEAEMWRMTLKPLEELIAGRCAEYFYRLTYPIRYGIHQNSAFSLALMIGYAQNAGNRELLGALSDRARTYFSDDAGCPVGYEPSGYDFLSPCLAEANLMRQVLSTDEFERWFSGFMPGSRDSELRKYLMPPVISDLSDPLLGHLIGLTFHRAWTLQEIALSFEEENPRRNLFLEISQANINSGLAWISDSGYGGTHWLATYAIAATGAL